MVRQAHLIALVVTFLLGCAVLLLGVGCSGTSSETSGKEQEPTEATKKEQTHSPEATASEEARCEGTRTIKKWGEHFTTNDLPGCPNKGGLLLGTDKKDKLFGQEGDDKIRGLGGLDDLKGGAGNDILYGGDGDDYVGGLEDEDLIYGGDGNDVIGDACDGQRDKIYGGEGKDECFFGKLDYVDSSCEIKRGPERRVCGPNA